MADVIEQITADLTEPQREAASHGEGPLLVVAGAGSGKTRVIIRRIAYLLATGVPPDRIVAMTFTNKAADEMRRRVESLVGEEVYVTTFHSFCARLLRREVHRLGRDRSFTIYDRTDSLRIVRQVVRDMQLDEDTYSPRDILDFISMKKDNIVTPQVCRSKALGIEEQTYAEVYADYEDRLLDNNALDFDDLLLKVLDVFSECPEVLADLQDNYLHVLVDEYQDTNLAQHLIARALQGKHRNITAVGDPDQMIYSWRGARLENLLEFEEDFPGARVVMLERNYRSMANILRAASACIANNQLRHEKALWTDRDAGEPVVLRGFRDSYDEGRWVAGKVQELLDEGVKPTEVAVFYRTKQQSLPLEDAFAALALPHQVVDSVGFFDRKQVKDLRAYLQLLVNPRDAAACARIINTPTRGIGAKTLERLQEEAKRRDLSLLETARRAEEIESLGTRATRAVTEFCHLYHELSELETGSMRELVKRLLQLTDYVEQMPASDRQDAQELADMFQGYAREYDERNPNGGLINFLEQAALVSDVDGWKAEAAAVPFMTLHSAKGLEFDAVFIVGVEEGLLPHYRALQDRTHGSEQGALEEERRLFYVGMTRARERLFITHGRRRVTRGRDEAADPSRFLDELPADSVDRRQATRSSRPGGGFRKEMDYVLKKKRLTLQILDGGDGRRLAKGVAVKHPRYGEGRILKVEPMGARHMVRVNFADHGTMALLLSSEDVGTE